MVGTIIVIIVFAIIGIVFSKGNGSFLIAGFNTLPKEEKEKYDVVALCKFMGKMMFAICFSMAFWLLSDLLDIKWLFTVGIVIFMSIVVFILFYLNTGNRFKKL